MRLWVVAYDPRTVPGSIVANTYFIKQFATVCSKGSCALDARYVGAFTGVQSVGQIIGMLVSPLRYMLCRIGAASPTAYLVDGIRAAQSQATCSDASSTSPCSP